MCINNVLESGELYFFRFIDIGGRLSLVYREKVANLIGVKPL
jgi:hypothetical protein